MRHAAFMVMAVIGTSCIAIVAQGQEPSLQPGNPVRLTMPCAAVRSPCREVGEFVSVQHDTLTIERSNTTTNYDLNAINQLEVSHGRRSHWLAGAGIGLLGGAIIGGVAGSTTTFCLDECTASGEKQAAIAVGVILGAPAGCLLGAVIGALIRTEKWQNVPIERLRVGLGPRPGSNFAFEMAATF